MGRAVSVPELLKTKFKRMQFDGRFKDSFGVPAQTGVWIVWGESGNGKTSFMLQLCKYLTRFGKVAYNTLEEGVAASMQEAAIEQRMIEVKNRFQFLDAEPLNELFDRLEKPKSPDIVVIDSWQYTGMTKKDYIRMKERFKKRKLIIINSHADGRLPEGRPARFIRFDADVKCRVEGYKVFPVSRLGGGVPFVIWEKGANEYWGTSQKTEL